jgi:glucans biosynthesis protein
VAVFARTAVTNYGIAPLTSMFWFGENSADRFGDFRPEVHDSDGILMHNGAGEWLWRPLVNDRGLRVASFLDRNPRGFGLMQRDRNFASYADTEALYHIRPSLWAEPVGDWGPGAIRLVEIPTHVEYGDNIVAFFAPEKKLAPGDSARYAYRLYWTSAEMPREPLGQTVSTRIGRVPGQDLQQRFVLDFTWPNVAADAQGEPPEGIVTAGNGEVLSPVGQYNPHEKTWRLFFLVKAAKAGVPVEIRATLRKGGRSLTETWTYLWIP